MNQKIKVIIVQLTRIGDILQTYQMVKQAKSEYPNLEVSLVTRKKFSEGIKFLLKDCFNEIFEIDPLDFLKHNKNLDETRKSLRSFYSQINKHNYDLAINISFNKSSSYLTSLINAKSKMGLTRNHVGELAINDKWSQYVYSTVMLGKNNPFNLVEIYRNILGVKTFSPEADKNNFDDLIVVHPFASHAKKKWNINKWFETIYTLVKKNPNIKIAIVGSPDDTKEQLKLYNFDAFKDIKNNIQLTAGEFEISDTFELLNKAKLFIGHDSMVAHMAAITNTPSIVVSLGTVRAPETTPYHEKVINIVPKSSCYPCALETSCSLYSCHLDINHQVVAAISQLILDNKEISKDTLYEHVSTFHLSSCKLYYPQIDKKGHFKLINFTDDYLSFDECIHLYYQLIWSLYLKGEELSTNFPTITKNTATKLSHNLAGLQYSFELFNFGAKYSKQLVEEGKKQSTNSETVSGLITKLSEIDRLCEITKSNYPLLAPLIDFFYVAKANAKGNSLTEIAENYMVLFHDSLNISAMLFELIENTLAPFEKTSKNLESN